MAMFLVFGITGNLARHKMLPALFNLYARKEVDQNNFLCIGVGRKKISKEEFHALIKESIDEVTSANFKDRLDIKDTDVENFKHNFVLSSVYVQGELNDPALYSRLKKDLDIGLLSKKDGSIFCKLSLPPSMHEGIIDRLVESKIMLLKTFHLMIEKPFGQDAVSAKKLYTKIASKLDPKKLILIDHYLGKEPVIDLMNIRLLGYMEHVLCDKNIKQIEVRVLEKKLVSGRGMFYDDVGALKDVGQNHLLQVLATAAADYKDIKDLDKAKTLFINSLKLDLNKPHIFGQYKGFLDEEHVKPDSKTETFFSIGLRSSLKKWKGTRFRMTFGKAMKEVRAEIIYTFNDKSTFVLPIAEKDRSAYEYVLLGALHGNNMLRADIGQIIAGWKLMEAIKKYQESKNSKLIPYDKHGNFFDKLKNTV